MGKFLDGPGTTAGAVKQIKKATEEHDEYLLSIPLPKCIRSQIPTDNVEARSAFLKALDLDFLTDEEQQKVMSYREDIESKERELLSLIAKTTWVY